MSRIRITFAPPVEFEGRRYEEIDNGHLLGLAQRTGMVAVIDLASGARVGVLTAYDYPRDPGMEEDVEDVFFATMEIDPQARELVVESERGDRFAVRLDDGVSRPVPGGRGLGGWRAQPVEAAPAAVQRREAPLLSPVCLGDMLYETMVDDPERADPCTVWIVARDPGNAPQWAVALYHVWHDTYLEKPFEDVYPTSLTLSDDGRRLLVGDELGRRFEVDLTERSARRVDGD